MANQKTKLFILKLTIALGLSIGFSISSKADTLPNCAQITAPYSSANATAAPAGNILLDNINSERELDTMEMAAYRHYIAQFNYAGPYYQTSADQFFVRSTMYLSNSTGRPLGLRVRITNLGNQSPSAEYFIDMQTRPNVNIVAACSN